MRLCFIGSLASIHTVRWARYFAERGDEVYVLTPSRSIGSGLEGVSVTTFRDFRTRIMPLDLLVNGAIMLPRVLQLRAFLRRIRPDVVHVHYINDLALFAAVSGFKPLVVTAWGSDVLLGPKKHLALRLLVQLVIRKASLITCDAEHMKRALVQLGAHPSKVHIIFFGTDTEKFHPARRDTGLRSQLGIGSEPAVISLRRMEPLYDLETLIRAIPLVLARCPESTFVVGGTGSLEAHLKEMVAALGVTDQVRFVGQLSEADTPRYLASADVYVSTSPADAGLSASTAEAMASQLPVIITDVADNRAWVEDGVSGFLVPPTVPQALAARIVQLIQNRELGEQMGQRARQVIVERNNWAKEMGRMQELYQQLVGQKKEAGSSVP